MSSAHRPLTRPFWLFVDALDEYAAGVDPRRLERLDPLVRAELGQVLPSLADAGSGRRRRCTSATASTAPRVSCSSSSPPPGRWY